MNPGPTRQRIKQFPTPKVADLIYTETFDATRRAFPAFGTAHPDTVNYPDHILVHITQADDQGLTFHYHYASDRAADQEDYNYALTYPYGGDTRYPRITRTYILSRGENQLELGSADPGGPIQAGGALVITSTGGNVITSTGGNLYGGDFTTAILVGQSERPLPEPLGSIYVEVTRIYDVVPGLESASNGDGTHQADGGYTVERPIQDKNWLRLTWRLTLPRETADSYRSDSFSACPVAGYGNLKLVNETIQAVEENNQVSNITRVYVGKISDSGEDTPSAPVIRRSRELPGVMPPAKFCSAVIERDDIEEILYPADASVSTWTPPAGYVLMAIMVEPDGTDSGRRTAKTGYYGSLHTLEGKQWDENLRDYVDYSVQVMSPAAAAAFAEASGVEMTITPINYYWSQVMLESPTEVSILPNGVAGSSSYYTMVPYTWPAQLVAPVGIYNVPIRDKDGAIDTNSYSYFVDYTIKRAWNGLCKARVDIGWQKTSPSLTVLNEVEFMQPESININWPIFNLNIPATLHVGDTLYGRTGNNHPNYGDVTFVKIVDPTNYTEWPASIVAEYSITPYKGGFRLERTIIYKPE